MSQGVNRDLRVVLSRGESDVRGRRRTTSGWLRMVTPRAGKVAPPDEADAYGIRMDLTGGQLAESTKRTVARCAIFALEGLNVFNKPLPPRLTDRQGAACIA